MIDIEYISTFIMGLTFGATTILATTMLTAMHTGHNSRWRKYLLGITGFTMLTHMLTLVYRVGVDICEYSDDSYFRTGAILLDMFCIAPLAIIEMMLTRHTVLSFKSMLAIYSPFIILALLHFCTGIEAIKIIALAFAIIAGLGWSWMTYKDMNQYNTMLRQSYSNFEGRDLTWLVRILMLLLFALAIWSTSTIIGTQIAKIFYRIAIVFIWFSLCRRVYLQKEATEIEDLSSLNGNVFLIKKPLDAPIEPNVFLVGKQIDELMRTKMLFTKYDITTSQVAQELNCSKTLIAQYFTSKGTTFHNYINDLRLDYAAEELLKKNDTMMDIATRSGYQFDTVFYRAFQQKFGCTPHEYRNKYRRVNQ